MTERSQSKKFEKSLIEFQKGEHDEHAPNSEHSSVMNTERVNPGFIHETPVKTG
jgi:hypothetical protein